MYLCESRELLQFLESERYMHVGDGNVTLRTVAIYRSVALNNILRMLRAARYNSSIFFFFFFFR